MIQPARASTAACPWAASFLVLGAGLLWMGWFTSTAALGYGLVTNTTAAAAAADAASDSRPSGHHRAVVGFTPRPAM